MLSNDTCTMTMPVQPAYQNGNGGCGWGGDWFGYILLFAILFGGYGYGGFGGGFGGGNALQGALTRGDLCMDMSFQDVKEGVAANGAAMQAGFRNIDNAICQLGYNNAQLANGIQMQIANEGRGLDNAVCNLGYNTQLGFNTLGAQLADCCCKTQTAIGDAKMQSVLNANGIQNAVQSGFCQTNYNAQTNTRDIIEAQNANTRAILDKLTAQEIAAKDATIAAQNQRLFAAELAASQAAQTNSLVNQLRPCPIPAYPTCNPWAGSGYGGCGCAAG